MNKNIFATVQQQASEKGVNAALESMAIYFRANKMFPELFEILKMQAREKVGIPVLQSALLSSQTDNDQQRRLEDLLLDACKEVGTLLLRDGRLNEAWVYLEPIADQEYVRQLVTSTPVTEENIDQLIEIGLGQQAAPSFGFDLLIQHRGTCNAITTFDSFVFQLATDQQQQIAGQLLQHIHSELLANIIDHVRAREDSFQPENQSIKQIIDNRKWLFETGGHHLDVTHLASIVRIARIVEDNSMLTLAADICHYGLQLNKDMQFAGETPFENTYRDHLLFFETLMQENPEPGLQHFKTKADSEVKTQSGNQATEIYIQLLQRLGRFDQVIEVATQWEGDEDVASIALHNVINATGRLDDLGKLMKHYQNQQDLLGFGVCLLKSLEQKK